MSAEEWAVQAGEDSEEQAAEQAAEDSEWEGPDWRATQRVNQLRAEQA